ncbi:MAG: glycosyltransferase [Anaerolineaceae bacterium]|nr:glycosyltransferase [Anaerolineaceae bacterium]
MRVLQFLGQLGANEVWLLQRASTRILVAANDEGQTANLMARAFRQAHVTGLLPDDNAVQSAHASYPSLQFINYEQITDEFTLLLALTHDDTVFAAVADACQKTEFFTEAGEKLGTIYVRDAEKTADIEPAAQQAARIDLLNWLIEEERRRYSTAVDDLQTQLSEIKKERDQYKNQLMLAERQAADQARQLKLVTQSTIWRMFEPYRKLRNLIHDFRNRRKMLSALPSDGGLIASRSTPAQPSAAQRPTPEAGTIEHTLAMIVGTPEPHTTFDVLVFSIIDLEARFQRPQQMAAHLAAAGLRVFYISAVKFLPANDKRPFVIREMAAGLFEVILRSSSVPSIYKDTIPAELQTQWLDELDQLSRQKSIHTAIQLVQFPFWAEVVLKLRDRTGWPIVYDCMDEWEDFPGITDAVVAQSTDLLRDSNLVTVTAQVLYDKYAKQTRKCLLIRNAVAFDLFAKNVMPNDIATHYSHPIIGYYGALAEWLDYDLLIYLAKQRPQWTFIFLGDIFVDVDALKALPNVHLLGRKPHEEMPLYLYHFDVCLIPFKINKITDAVDPVKMYEYLSAGKPVVAARILELKHYEDVLYLAETHEEFLEKIEWALAEDDADLQQKRIALARKNDWHHRVGQLQRAVSDFYPMFSIVIVTWKNLDLTQQCVESIFRNTDYPNYEIIVVDNASDDGTPDYLKSLAAREDRVKVILNDENRGFAAANNQGIQLAEGENVLLLNNDTIVTRGWLTGLGRYLRDEKIGMVGPVTNFVGNAARIDVPYKTVEDMETFANDWMRDHHGESFEIDMLAMFCVAMRRSLIDEIGLLDESYGIGMFEDDDYAERTKAAGYDIICARDIFIHHHGQASFKLLPEDEYQALWESNQSYYEGKFDKKWLQTKSETDEKS